MAPDDYPAQDGTVGPQRSALLDQSGDPLAVLGIGRPGIEVVGEDHRGPAEDLVLQGHQIVDGNVVLQPAAVADDRPAGDIAVLAYAAILADRSPPADMTKMPDLGPFSHIDRQVGKRCFMQKIFGRHVASGQSESAVMMLQFCPNISSNYTK